MRWPLVALCSIKVKSPENNFKPEYIIPQLLLQWIRNNKEFDGIAYDSTHIDKNQTPHKGYFQNFVLPVSDNKIEGYCDFLCDIFDSTPSLCMKEILLNENYFKENKLRPTNSSHPTTIVKAIGEDNYIPYSDSLLSKIQMSSHYLPKVKLSSLLN